MSIETCEYCNHNWDNEIQPGNCPRCSGKEEGEDSLLSQLSVAKARVKIFHELLENTCIELEKHGHDSWDCRGAAGCGACEALNLARAALRLEWTHVGDVP